MLIFSILAAIFFVAVLTLNLSVIRNLKENPGKKLSELERPLMLRLRLGIICAALLAANAVAAIMTG